MSVFRKLQKNVKFGFDSTVDILCFSRFVSMMTYGQDEYFE